MHPIIQRLKERKLVQWGVAYLAGAVALYSALDAFAEPWGVGGLQLRIAQVALLVGFFVALTLAWYHGERGEQRVTGVELLILAGIMGLGALGIRLVTTGPAAAPQAAPAVVIHRMPRLAPNHAPLADFEFGPQGTGVVYALRASGGPKWFRQWDELAGRPIPGSTGGNNLVSPSGEFFSEVSRGRELRIISLLDGSIVRRQMEIWGAARWGGDGYLYFPGPDSTIHKVAESLEGEIEPLGLERLPGDLIQRYYRPALRGGRAVFWVGGERARIEGHYTRTGERVVLVEGGSQPRLTPTGHLVYSLDGQIMAASIDLSDFRLGRPVAVVDGRANVAMGGVTVGGGGSPGISWSLSSDGVLGYWEAPSGGTHRLVRVSEGGGAIALDPGWSFDAGTIAQWSFSPGGAQVAYRVSRGVSDVYMKDLRSGVARRLMPEGMRGVSPQWTSDTTLALLNENRVIELGSDGVGEPVELFAASRPLVDLEVGPNGWMVVNVANQEGMGAAADADLVAFKRGEGGDARPLLADPGFLEQDPALSPDGQWIAYSQNPSGSWEVTLRPFPEVQSMALPISPVQGRSPAWSEDGSTLYYLSFSDPNEMQYIVAAALTFEPRPRVTSQDTVMALPADFRYSAYTRFQPTTDPNTFILAGLASSEPQLVVIQNWFEELKRLVPN